MKTTLPILPLAALFFGLPAHAHAQEPAAPEVAREVATAPGPPSPDLRGWFIEPPFQRVLDLQIGLAGWPGLWGFCAEANPRWYVSIEACWDTNYNILANYNDLSLGLKSRALEWLGLRQDGSRITGNQVGLGPAVAWRFQHEVEYQGLGGLRTTDSHALDAGLSLEWVHWSSRYFGVTMQWEAGPEALFREGEVLPTFFVRYTLGVAF